MSANVSIGDVTATVTRHRRERPPLAARRSRPSGDGAGHFPTAYDLGPDRGRSFSGRLVDIDGDGDSDIVISDYRPYPKLVYINDVKGHFHVDRLTGGHSGTLM